jgi:mannose-1-phosphate guanylyltransferase
VWAVVLAAGEGTRLAALTTDSAGNAVPKQFCSLDGGKSLLQEAVVRAGRAVPAEQVCVLVGAHHRRYWPQARWTVRPENVIVQPANRGTAHGVLLGLLSILARDPFARIVFLPSDHFVQDESALAETVRLAVGHVEWDTGAVVLVGIQPHEPDPELGYIVPGRTLRSGAYTVRRFVEKPGHAVATQLLQSGALWNSFLFVARGWSLLSLFSRRIPHSVAAMDAALARHDRASAIPQLYETLPSIDFSRSITQGCEESLRVAAAPACGWSDLGTPSRVAEALGRLDLSEAKMTALTTASNPSSGPVNLAVQHARFVHTNLRTTS